MVQNIRPVEAERIGQFLAEGFVGAIAVGRAEVGPRALGHRSILADARRLELKERINGLIKQRRAFQPLAPVCLREDLETYFELPPADISLAYMGVALRCREVTLRDGPAVVHADATARVQVVDEAATPLLAAALRACRARTGVGLLINTSFNGPGEPIVNTAAEALDAYRRLDLDFLVLDRHLISSRLC